MASVFFNNYFEELGKGNINFTSNEFKLMLMTTSYTPNVDTHVFRADVTGEASGSGYTAGGQVVNNVTLTQDNTNNRAVVDFDTEVWTNVTLSNIDGAILYKNNSNAALDVLVCYLDFTEGSQDVVANDFTVTPNVAGVLTIG